MNGKKDLRRIRFFVMIAGVAVLTLMAYLPAGAIGGSRQSNEHSTASSGGSAAALAIGGNFPAGQGGTVPQASSGFSSFFSNLVAFFKNVGGSEQAGKPAAADSRSPAPHKGKHSGDSNINITLPTPTPGGPTETPSGPTETPTDWTQTPVDATETPGGPTATPGGTTETPGPTGTPGQYGYCGEVWFENDYYGCTSLAGIYVWDPNLNTDPEVEETVDVLVTSDSDPVGVFVTLTEEDGNPEGEASRGTDSNEFYGTLQFSDTESGPGYLLVADGDTVTVTYEDANCDGYASRGYPQTVTYSVTMDCQPPTISDVSVSDVHATSATISWTTDKDCDAVVVYGLVMPPVEEYSDNSWGTYHSVTVYGLLPCNIYYFMVVSHDYAGNEAFDDNGGNYYTFTTLSQRLMMSATMDNDPGWTATGPWAWGQPAGQCGDPGSGYTGSNVYGTYLNGCYPNNMGWCSLTTPAIDCSSAVNTTFSFYGWLGVESNWYDHATVQVSNDGSNFTTLYSNPSGSLYGGYWSYYQYDISAYADGHSAVYLRWTLGPSDYSVTYCGWNIDDVTVSFEGPCTTPFLYHYDHTIDDSAGNSNGTINPGETITMPVTLIDYSLFDATGISAELTTTSPYVTITQASADYPDIAAHTSASSIAPHYQFTVSTDAPDGASIDFTLNWTCNESSGTDVFYDNVHSPIMEFESYTLDDSLGNNNG